MDKNLTVEIFVPTLGSDGRKGKIGTGYPVGKALVLTARHVLFPDDRDPDYPIQIRWRHPGLQEGEKGWVDIEDIPWAGDEMLDTALIKAEFPRAIDGWGFLTSCKPDNKMVWESEGFAKAGGKDDGARRPVALGGRTRSAGDLSTEFELINDGPAAEEELWQGASGSPVFVGRRVIGVVVKCPQNFNATRFRAIPCWRLLENKAFRDAIGYDDQMERRHRYKAMVSDLLKASPNSIRAVIAELGSAADDLVGKEAEQRAADLADKLLDLGIESLILACRKAQQRLQQDDLKGDAALLSRMVRLLLPGVYDFGAIQGFQAMAADFGQGFVSLPASLDTVAEIVMAGTDGREVLYRDCERFPKGAYSLPMAPEGGWDESGEAFQQAWDTHLTNQFGDGAIGAMNEAWDEYMIGQFAGDRGTGRKRNRDDLVRFAADELEYLATTEHKTHYFVFDLPDEQPARGQAIELIKRLKERYPSVAFLNLDSDPDLERQERKSYRPLSDILSAENPDLP